MICLDSLLLIAPLFGLENCCKSIFDGETREKSFPEALVHNYSSCFSGVLQKRRPIAYLSTWNNLQWVKLPEKSWMRCFSVSVSCQQFLHSHVNLSLSKRGFAAMFWFSNPILWCLLVCEAIFSISESAINSFKECYQLLTNFSSKKNFNIFSNTNMSKLV